MTSTPDKGAAREKWQRIYNQMSPQLREAHDREKARRHEAKESRQREAIARAVQEALAVQLPQALAEAGLGVEETALHQLDADGWAAERTDYWGPRLRPLPVPAEPVKSVEPAEPLHSLTEEDWQATRLAYWETRLPRHGAPQTIDDLRRGFRREPPDTGGA